MDSGLTLLLPFDVDDPQFSRGFECGHVWTKLRETDEREFLMHVENAEMAIRIGEALGLIAHSDEAGTGWIEVTFDDPGPGSEEDE